LYSNCMGLKMNENDVLRTGLNGFGERLNKAERDTIRVEERTRFNKELIGKVEKSITELFRSMKKMEIRIACIIVVGVVLSKLWDKLI